MGLKPSKAADNIYCKCRLEAAKNNDRLKSREGAAELLGLSISSLSDYELGLTKVVPVDKVALMADLYNAPELRNYYCRECCPLGSDTPKVDLEGLDRISIRTFSASEQINQVKTTLLKIVSDGVITDDELPDLQMIYDNLSEFDSTIQSFKLFIEKNYKEVINATN